MAKFKVGDIIRGNKKSDEHYMYTDSRMTKAKVVQIYAHGVSGDIEIEVVEHTSRNLIGHKFDVNSKYFDLVENETIVIYRKDNEVIALDKSTGKKAVAKCSPFDKFDFMTGAKLAFERLNETATFRMLAIKSGTLNTKGKVYEFINGKCKWDDGYSSCPYNSFKEFVDTNPTFSQEFIELKDGDDPKELMKKYDEVKVGDTVKVVNTGKMYTTCISTLRKITDDPEILSRYAFGYSPYNEGKRELGGTFRVIAVSDDNDKVLISSSNFGKVLLIGKDGIKKC